MTSKEHWEKVFSTKQEPEVSWFQPYPKTSVDFLELFDLPMDANIIDIGGGDSHFVDALLDKGYTNVYVLEVASPQESQSHLGGAVIRYRSGTGSWL